MPVKGAMAALGEGLLPLRANKGATSGKFTVRRKSPMRRKKEFTG